MAEQRRVMLVTGVDRGMGREIARQLAERELQVILTARDAARAEAAAVELRAAQREIVAHQLDVTDQASVDRLAADIERVDALVNNAGADPGGRSAGRRFLIFLGHSSGSRSISQNARS